MTWGWSRAQRGAGGAQPRPQHGARCGVLPTTPTCPSPLLSSGCEPKCCPGHTALPQAAGPDPFPWGLSPWYCGAPRCLPPPSPVCTTGAMSRFQRVTLVQAVSRMSGARCSPSPEMKREGKEVEICRNWSAKNRGATLVFSLPGRNGAAANSPGVGAGGAGDPPAPGGLRALITGHCGHSTKQNQASAEPWDCCFPNACC